MHIFNILEFEEYDELNGLIDKNPKSVIFDLEKTDTLDKILLIELFKKQNITVLEILFSHPEIKNKININIEDKRRDYPLKVAIKNNNIDLIHLLLDQPNLNLDMRYEHYDDPVINHLFEIHDTNTLEVIFNHPKVKSLSLYKIIDFIIKFDNLNAFKILIKNFNYTEIEDLVNITELIIREHRLTRYTKNIHLYIDYLLSLNNNILNEDLKKEIFVASFKDLSLFKYISNEKNIDINIKDESTDNTLLILACQQANINIVNILLNKNNIEINSQNKKGDTALHIACDYLSNKRNDDMVDIIASLLNFPKIILNIKNKMGVEPFDTVYQYTANFNRDNQIEVLDMFLTKNIVLSSYIERSILKSNIKNKKNINLMSHKEYLLLTYKQGRKNKVFNILDSIEE